MVAIDKIYYPTLGMSSATGSSPYGVRFRLEPDSKGSFVEGKCPIWQPNPNQTWEWRAEGLFLAKAGKVPEIKGNLLGCISGRFDGNSADHREPMGRTYDL